MAASFREDAWKGHGVAVRINAAGTPYHERDVVEVVEAAGDALGSIVLPKVERIEDVEALDRLLAGVEQRAGRSRPVAIQALIETAGGLARVNDIALGPRLEALIIGYADLAASLGRYPGAARDGDPWQFARESVLVGARAAGLGAIDGPHLEIGDLGGLREAALRARAAGYDGKWAIHPTQIGPLNDIFAPSDEELDRAQAILAALAPAREGGPGALLFEGEMIDEASAKLAQRVVARSKRTR